MFYEPNYNVEVGDWIDRIRSGQLGTVLQVQLCIAGKPRHEFLGDAGTWTESTSSSRARFQRHFHAVDKQRDDAFLELATIPDPMFPWSRRPLLKQPTSNT